MALHELGPQANKSVVYAKQTLDPNSTRWLRSDSQTRKHFLADIQIGFIS